MLTPLGGADQFWPEDPLPNDAPMRPAPQMRGKEPPRPTTTPFAWEPDRRLLGMESSPLRKHRRPHHKTP